MHRYRDLRVWNMAVALAREVYRCTDGAPADETYGAVSQMRRSASSIAYNIAEGAGRTTNKEFRRYIDIAIGSANELDTQVAILRGRKWLPEKDAEGIRSELGTIQRMLQRLKGTLSE